MKKTFAALLALVLAFTVLTVIPSAAGTNPEYELEYTENAPIVDGDISSKEYGSPLVSWMVSDGEEDGIALALYEIKDDPNLSIDFYATWTETDLYLAWKVHTKYDFRVPDGIEDGYMYEYCCVQFILTPGAPDNSTKKYQTSEWSGDYLEVGLTMRDDGLSYKVCWSQPAAAGNALQTSDWEFAGSRDDDKEISIYECRLPLNKTGIEVKGDGAQFGLTWAVGAQENYEKVTKGLIEWQDAIVGGKAADNAAIMTMVGSGEGQQNVEVGVVSRDDMPHGDLPEGMEESPMQITMLNVPVGAEQTSLVTDPSKINDYNPNYAHTLLLRPAGELNGLEGYYTVMEGVTGPGGAIEFTNEVQEGDLALILHTDASDSTTEQAQAVELAKTLPAGQTVYLHGVAMKDGGLVFLYNNAQLVVVEDSASQLIGTWKTGDGKTLILAAGGTGTLDGEAVSWSLDENDALTFNGEAAEWALDGETLTIAGVAYTKYVPGDYSKLEAQIKSAESQLSKKDDYTAESLAAVQTAYDKAKEVLEAGYGADEQDKIDEAVAALSNAITALEKVAAEESSSAEQSGTSSAASSSSDSSDESDAGGLSGGIIAVIVVAAVVIVGGVIAIIVAMRKKKAE